MTTIGIVDLDMSNLRSVANAVRSLGYDCEIVSAPDEFRELSHVILPGVGAYRTAMENMHHRKLYEPLRAFAASGKPLLGICLGMQLLSTTGDEGGPTDGLGLIRGHVRRLDLAVVPAIPHVGWNELRIKRTHRIFERVRTGVDFYFVHSFHLVCASGDDQLGAVDYGGNEYCAAVGHDNVLGFQFHPEKSQASGLRLLENFCEWDGRC